ncbi:hypothetical protein KR032_008336 [Drosophila birchii]|nr:hypothetical protein KR032_008336 [Drosophila birchii]
MTGLAGVAAMRALVLGIFAILCLSISAKYLEPGCGIRENLFGFRINNGTEAQINFHPWMAYLHNSNRYVCGGTLIHRRFVLTAAHCLIPRLKVRLGEYNYMAVRDCTVHGCSPRSEEHDIARALKHPGFSRKTGANDIALLLLSQSVEYKAHIRPICIILDPWKMPNLPYHKDFIATGWGDTRTNRTRGTLQEVTLRRYEIQRCEDSMSRPMQEDQFCAGSPYGDTCNGDSGGPLGWSLPHNDQMRYVQLGVVSYGSPQCSGVGVNTDVMVHVPWIQQMVKSYTNN